MYRWLSLISLLAVAHAQNWQLVWEDNFDTLDLDKWEHEITASGGANGEFQTYTQDPANSFVKDGVLYIQPTLTVNNTNPLTGEPYGNDFLHNGVLDMDRLYGLCTNPSNMGCLRYGKFRHIPPVMSARLRTKGKFTFQYGRVEIRAKMPAGDWFWPAIWALPEENVYGDWPISGEIDIVEIISNSDLVQSSTNESIGSNRMGSALHWGTAWNENRYDRTHKYGYNTTHSYGNYFHNYTFEWSPNGFTFFTDDNLVLTAPNPPINENPSWQGFYEFGKPWNIEPTNPWTNGTNLAPFDQSFHFVMNVATGTVNGYIPDDVTNRGGAYPKPWTNGQGYYGAMLSFWENLDNWYWTWTQEGDNNAMKVDYIRVYQK